MKKNDQTELNSRDKKVKTSHPYEKSATRFVAPEVNAESLNTEKQGKNRDSTPWLNSDGSEKKINDLKKIAKGWGGKDWDRYLAYLKTKETRIREELLSPEKFDQITDDDYKEALSGLFRSGNYKEVNATVNMFMADLSNRQKTVVFLRYGEQLTLEEISAKLGITKLCVRTHLRRGEEKINQRLEKLLKEGGSSQQANSFFVQRFRKIFSHENGRLGQ